MPKPTLVVGIGGTGQWVLTWLKRDLIETFGEVPPQVQLLAFDTTTTVEASATQAVEGDEQQVRIGDIVLEPKKEFVHIGGDAYDFANEIGRGRHPHVQQWFEAKFWLKKLNPSAFILEEGAGRIRPLGRLALFHDMIEEGGKHILNPLRTKLQNVRNAMRKNEGQKMTIVVTASFAGGTGSGLFLDISLLLHLLAQQQHIDYTMVGFFVLPWAFTPHPNDEMLARAFAAWRELNRFMVVHEDFSLPEIVYDPAKPDLRLQPTRRLFDYAYLIDGRFRDGRTVAEEAQYGTHPAIAAAVWTLFIDDESSKAYNEKVLTNLHPVFARNPGDPLYTAFGLKMIKVPAYYQQEQALLNLTHETVQQILAPARDLRYIDVLIDDENWLQQVALVDRNPEDPGVAGRKRAPQIFSLSVQYDNMVGKPTRFLARLGQLLERMQEERQKVVEELARVGLGRGGSWASFFPDLGDDPQYQKLRDEVGEHLRFDVRKSYARRPKEKGAQARRRFRDIPEEARKRFGITSIIGQTEEEYQGEFGEVLQRIRMTQVDIFRHLIRLHLLRILNGTDADPLKARTGKLGYAWDFMDGVVEALDKLIALMDEVWQYREEKVRPEIKIAERLRRAEARLKATANKPLCFLLPFIEHPEVRRAEEAYLRAWQERINARREDLMHRAVRATLADMRDVAQLARDRLRHWILHLSSGDPSAGVVGLWEQAEERMRMLAEVYGYDRRLRKIQSLFEDPEILQRLRELESLLRQILERWLWDVSKDLKVEQRFLPRQEGETEVHLEDPFLQREPKWREEVSKANFQRLRQALSPYVPQVVEEIRVAERIKQEFGRGQDAIKAFVRRYELDHLPAMARLEGTAAKESTLIAVQSDANDPFFYGAYGLEGELREKLHLARERVDDNHPVMAVNFENPYKFIALHTEELHPPAHYRAWSECQDAYQKHIRNEYHELNPVHLHIFGAEALAAKIERYLTTKQGLAYQALSPRVVLLLEDKGKLLQFFYLWGLNHIYETPRDEPPYRWEFSLPGEDSTIWLTPGWEPGLDRPRPTAMDAAHGYVIHGLTYEPGRSWRIDYDKVKQWLRDRWRGKSKERLDFLKRHVDPSRPRSLARRLKRLIERAETPTEREEYQSLLWTLQYLFNEEIEYLEQ